MRIPLVFCAIVFAFHRVDCTLGDFFNNLPTEIGNAFTNAWNTIVTAIKKPVRIKRLGRAKTTTTTSTTHAPIKNIYTRVFTTSTLRFNLVDPVRRLMLPILTSPKWQNLEQWKKLQKPMFVKLKPGLGTTNPVELEDNDIGGDQNPAKLHEEDALGSLMFVKK